MNQGQLRRRVAWLGLTLILLIVAAEAYEAWQDRRAALDRGNQAVGLLARMFADQTARITGELDYALADFAEWRGQSTGAPPAAAATRDWLVAHIKRLPYVHSAAVFDADGTLRATTGDPPANPVNVAKSAIFRGAADATDEALFVGAPWTSRRDGYRSFAVSRRYAGRDGHLAGVIVVRVAFEYLARFYAAVDVSPGARIRLLRDDGRVLAQYPVGEGDEAAAAAPAAQADDVLAASDVVRGYPMRIEVSQPRSEALAAARRVQLAGAVRSGAFALLAGGLLLLLVMAMRRSEQADAARRASDARLQEARKAEALSLLAATVAHDFNNVLGAIIGYGELAREDAAPGSKLRQRLDGLLVAAERARQLVRRVLTFDTRRSLNYGAVDLDRVVREVLDQLGATLPPSIILETAVPAEGLVVLGDATELHQVAMNLCSNAVRAMPSGGVLRVELAAVTLAAARACTVGQVEPGQWLRLSVADEGAGIEPARLADIFEPLHTTRAGGQGTGLGLTVVRNIVTSMRGAIDVDSQPGHGARFTVYWRAHPRPGANVVAADSASAATGAARATGSASAARSPEARTLLVVDDEPPLVALVEELCATLGYEPVGHHDPRLALEALRHDPQRFDGVITDVDMPGMGGLDLARAIHALRPELPVMLLTGYRTAQLDADARACGIAGIADKPVRAEEVRRMLEAAFRGAPQRG